MLSGVSGRKSISMKEYGFSVASANASVRYGTFQEMLVRPDEKQQYGHVGFFPEKSSVC